MNDEVAASGGVAWPRGDGGAPAPGLAVVCGFRDANFAAGIGVFHAGVEEAAIDEQGFALLLGDSAFGGLPGAMVGLAWMIRCEPLRAACQAGGVSVRIGVQWLSAPRIDSGIGISPRANEWTCLP